MADPLLIHDGELISGTVIERPNRFVLRVLFSKGGEPERVFLGDPGALEVLTPGVTVHCSPVADENRKTAYDAIAAEVDEINVSLRAALANDLFEAALAQERLPDFAGYTIHKREPSLPDHGRADFILTPPNKTGETYVEVKSCTHAENGVGKFPDRPTERGRRHLRSLQQLVKEGTEAHLVFVAQRPDIETIIPFREVDPDFADLLDEAQEDGVNIHAIAIEFEPPEYRLTDADIPVRSYPSM